MVIRFRNFRARFHYVGMVMRTAAFPALFWAAAMALPALAEMRNGPGGEVSSAANRQAKAPAPVCPAWVESIEMKGSRRS
jgi:hypothetical protein